MRPVRWLAVLIIGGIAPASAPGQHPIRESPTNNSCEICHNTHGLESGSVGLGADVMYGATVSGDGDSRPGPTSLNCLRCHTTAEQRSRQLEFSDQPLTALSDGKYLRPDLSDDHPLGVPGRSVDSADRARSLERLFERRTGSRFKTVGSVSNPDGLKRTECITCHDPHARTAKAWTPTEQWVLCNTCHDPAGYSAAEHARIECTACHRLHGGHDGALLAEYTADILCRSCHDASSPLAFSPSSTLLKSSGQSAHPQLPEGSCLDCHSMHR